MAPFPANYLKQNCKLRNVMDKWQKKLTKLAEHNWSNSPATNRGKQTKTTGIPKNTPKRGQHKQSLEMNSIYGKAFRKQKPQAQRNRIRIRKKKEPQRRKTYQKAKHAKNAGRQHPWTTGRKP